MAYKRPQHRQQRIIASPSRHTGNQLRDCFIQCLTWSSPFSTSVDFRGRTLRYTFNFPLLSSATAWKNQHRLNMIAREAVHSHPSTLKGTTAWNTGVATLTSAQYLMGTSLLPKYPAVPEAFLGISRHTNISFVYLVNQINNLKT